MPGTRFCDLADGINWADALRAGGSLVRLNWVITAAHVADNGPSTP